MDGDCDYALRISADANRDLVDRFYREVITKRRLDAIDELISEDFVDNGERRGREGQRRVYEEFFGTSRTYRPRLSRSLPPMIW